MSRNRLGAEGSVFHSCSRRHPRGFAAPQRAAHRAVTVLGLLFIAVLHFLREDDHPAGAVAAFRDALAPGSHIAVSHVAELGDDATGPARADATREAVRVYEELAAPFVLRTPEQITGLLTGLQPVDPGVVPVQLWQPARGRPGPAVPVLGGLGHVKAPHPGTALAARSEGEPPATHPGGSAAQIPEGGNSGDSDPDPDLDPRHGPQPLPPPKHELRRSPDHGNVPDRPEARP